MQLPENIRQLLFLFIVVLGVLLVTMGTYRSPAVALMPDVTPKPLRSKANAIINLMGAVGGIIYLVIAGWLMNRISYDALFPYSFVFITLAFVTMHFVRHGDSKVIGKRGLEAFDTDD